MPDYLSCGSCPVDFELADIVSFIEHKRQRCVDGSADSEELECVKCSKKFHTPWPLLFHIQIDHQILIVRNLNQLNFPLRHSTAVTPITQADDRLVVMETDSDQLQRPANQRDMFTQTQSFRASVPCCQPLSLPLCCKKIEPQCFDEPCICPLASDVICNKDSCYTKLDTQQTLVSDSKASNCCACPQSSVKKETREVQTEFEYNDDLDINFLLSSNNSNGIHGASFLSQQQQQYTNDFPVPMEKDWDYFNETSVEITELNNGNYLPNLDNSNYQLINQNIRLPSNNNQTAYVSANPNLIVDTHTRSLTSSPNQIVATTDNQGFTLLNNCTNNQSINGHVTLFQESNNSFHYKGQNGQDPQTMVNNLVVPKPLPTNNDLIALFVSNDSGPRPFIQSGSELSTDCSNENYENEKIENDRKEFRFLCTNCVKRFRQKVHLRKHVMSQHAHQKPHKCSECGYTTVEKSHLTVHIRTHTGERPFTCRRCSYSSAQNCTLKSHYLRRHPGDQIDCCLCGSHFITEQERNNHQRSCRIVNGITNDGSQNINRSDLVKTA